MAQQTRLATIVPYFERWMQRFPRVQDVAAAPVQDIVKLWEGLGYYRRALNIHRAAHIIMEQHAGQVPSVLADLRALPGIGRYTAGAILCLAFNQPEPAIDGNVVRVFSRLYRQPFRASRKRDLDIIDGEIRAILQHKQPGCPGMVAEALMGLGSRICRPQIPRCGQCPVSAHCRTYHHPESQLRIASPRRPRSELSIRHYWGLLLMAHHTDELHLLLVQHKPSGMLGGLWGFPALALTAHEVADSLNLQARVRDTLSLEIGPVTEFGSFTQDYSHFRRIQKVYQATCSRHDPITDLWADVRWVRPSQLSALPLSVLDQRIAQTLHHNQLQHG